MNKAIKSMIWLLPIIAICTVLVLTEDISDVSSAESSGRVLDSSSTDIGSWEYSAGVLTLNVTGTPCVIQGTDIATLSVTKVLINKNTQYYTVAVSLVGLDESVPIYYSGTITNGTWSYYDGKLSIDGTTSQTMQNWASASMSPWSKSFFSKSIVEATITGYTTVGKYAFYGCTNLETVMSSSVLSLTQEDSFKITTTYSNEYRPITNNRVENAALRCIDMPNVQTIGGNSLSNAPFFRFANLEEIHFNSVTSIGINSFYYCTKLSIVDLGSVETIKDNAFEACSINTLTLGKVKAIGDKSFKNNSALSSVTLSSCDDLQSIGVSAFEGCSVLSDLYLPNKDSTSRFTLGNDAFKSTNLSGNIDLSCVTSIGDNMFKGQSGITGISLVYVTSIGSHAFDGCSNISTSLILPDTLSSIGEYSFFNCGKIPSVSVGSGLNSIGDYAFAMCTSVASITVKADNASFSVSNNVLVSKDQATILLCPASSSSFNYTISDKVVEIKPYAFYQCGNVSFSGENPLAHIQYIGEHAFSGCTFKSVVLGPNLESLGAYAFENNVQLNEVVTSNSIDVLPEYLFDGCPVTIAHISSSIRNIGAHTFGYGIYAPSTAEFWFNGKIETIVWADDAVYSSKAMSIKFHVNNESVDTFKSRANNVMSANLTKTVVGEYISEVSLEGYKADYSYSSVLAICGGKIVLPFNKTAAGYFTNYFAVTAIDQDGNSHYLACFESEGAFESNVIASSGCALPIYPMVDNDKLNLNGSTSVDPYQIEISITDNTEVDLYNALTKIHYGMSFDMPSLLYSENEIDTIVISVTNGLDSDKRDITNLEGMTVNVGSYFDTFLITVKGASVDVQFINSTTGEKVIVSMNVGKPIVLTDEVRELEAVSNGFYFVDWISSNGVPLVNGVTTVKNNNNRWYTSVAPIEYHITITNIADSSAPKDTVKKDLKVYGPYQITVSGDTLVYDDYTGSGTLFNSSSVVGYTVSTYYESMAEWEGTDGKICKDINLVVLLQTRKYDFTLTFSASGSTLGDDVGFTISELSDSTYHSNDIIEQVDYLDIRDGYEIFIPKSDEYAFSKVYIGDKEVVANKSNRYFIKVSDFEGESAVIKYVVIYGQISITFVINDDNETISPYGLKMVGDSISVNISTFMTKVGYTFDYIAVYDKAGVIYGKYQEKAAIEITQEMVNSCSKSCAITFTVYWKSNPYKINYDADDGDFTVTNSSSLNVLIGNTVNFPEVVGYAGHEVIGWTLSSADDADIYPVDQVSLSQDMIRYYAADGEVTFHAVWGLKTYLVKVTDDSTGDYDKYNLKFGETITFWNIDDKAPAYQEFSGWLLDGIVYKKATTVIDSTIAAFGDENDDVITFEFNWTYKNYTVAYDRNGGSGSVPVDKNTYVYQGTFTLAGTGDISRVGFTFKGWSVTGDSTDYLATYTGEFSGLFASEANSDDVVTFYAIWEPQSYTIKYDLDGGKPGEDSPADVFYGAVVTISNPSYTGHKFRGWIAEDVTDGAQYRSGTDYVLWGDGTKRVTSTEFMNLTNVEGGEVTLIAVWDVAEYYVTVNYNGGSGTYVSNNFTSITIGSKFPTTDKMPRLDNAEKTGCEFVGWSLDGYNVITSGSKFTDAMVQDENSNLLTLYAVWEPVVYTLQYRYIEENGYAIQDVSYGEIYHISEETRIGYTFAGWKVTGVGDNAKFSKDGKTWYDLLEGQTVKAFYFMNLSEEASKVKLEAVWSAITYKFVYQLNGGSGTTPVDENEYEIGDSVKLKTFTDTTGANGNKSFVGWSLERNGNAVSITAFDANLADIADATRTVTLYAVWLEGEYTVTVNIGDFKASFIPSGWSGNGNGTYSKVYSYGTSTTEIMNEWNDVTLTKDGYVCNGWVYDTVGDNLVVSVKDEKVEMNIMYIVGGVIAAIAVVAVIGRFRSV